MLISAVLGTGDRLVVVLAPSELLPQTELMSQNQVSYKAELTCSLQDPGLVAFLKNSRLPEYATTRGKWQNLERETPPSLPPSLPVSLACFETRSQVGQAGLPPNSCSFFLHLLIAGITGLSHHTQQPPLVIINI